MERSFIKSQEIQQLEKALLCNSNNALSIFWKKIKKRGTPIIEKIDEDYSLVTLIYREDKPLRNVVLIGPVGMRKVEKCIMTKVINSDVWYISYKVKNNISFTYQFSPNDALDNDWNRRWKNVDNDKYNKNQILHFDKDTKKERMISYVQLEKARKKNYSLKYNGVPEGKIINSRVNSKALNEEREISIYFPYDYDYEKDKNPLKYLVLNDGEEYIKILSAANILDNLIFQKKIPRTIAVFVHSTKDRAENLKCSDKFAEFISMELKKFIKEKYNISDNPKDAVIGGYSLGGLMASYTALRYSNVFGNVISESGSYWYKRDGYNEQELWISKEYQKENKKDIKFYITVGEIEPEMSMKNTNIRFYEDLVQMEYKAEFCIFGSGHDFLYWDEDLADGLINIFTIS